MKHGPTGIPYARLDGFRRYGSGDREPSWQGAMMYCLRVNDLESAELILRMNTPRSYECEDSEHSYCRVGSCGCTCHDFEMAPVVGKPIRSCEEMESEREEEMEVV